MIWLAYFYPLCLQIYVRPTANTLPIFGDSKYLRYTLGRKQFLPELARLMRLIMTEVFLRRKQIEKVTGLARSTIYDKIKSGSFPKPVKIGDRAVAWLGSEIDEWQRDRIAEDRDK